MDIHMAFIILVANMWGIILKEWKGVSKKTARQCVGILTIILAVLIVGIGKHRHEKLKQKKDLHMSSNNKI
jgi:L-rhamnose-H+ transport protein